MRQGCLAVYGHGREQAGKRGSYQTGRGQDSLDKQIVRDYLLTLAWDQTYPGPALPDEIVKKAAARYQEIFEILTR